MDFLLVCSSPKERLKHFEVLQSFDVGILWVRLVLRLNVGSTGKVSLLPISTSSASSSGSLGLVDLQVKDRNTSSFKSKMKSDCSVYIS